MIIYDLFSGTGSSTQAFKDAGHTVISFEIDGNFVATQHVNILNLKAEDLIARYGRPDFIWASPPCTAFSVASMTKHWEKVDKLAFPKTDSATKGMELVQHTLNLIKEFLLFYINSLLICIDSKNYVEVTNIEGVII